MGGQLRNQVLGFDDFSVSRTVILQGQHSLSSGCGESKVWYRISFSFIIFFKIWFRGVFLELLRSSAIIVHDKVSTFAGVGDGNLLTYSVSVRKLLVKKRWAVNFHWS